MTFEERSLYYQIHPVKLFTDVSTALGSTYLLRKHMLCSAVLLAIIPSVVVSAIMIAAVDLEPYKNSSTGLYVKKYMDSPLVDAFRLSGFVFMAIGIWYQSTLAIIFGFISIAACRMRGLLFFRQSAVG